MKLRALEVIHFLTAMFAASCLMGAVAMAGRGDWWRCAAALFGVAVNTWLGLGVLPPKIVAARYPEREA